MDESYVGEGKECQWINSGEHKNEGTTKQEEERGRERNRASIINVARI